MQDQIASNDKATSLEHESNRPDDEELKPDLAEAAEFYKAYEEHSKVLRTWLVAYGVGAPVLLATNDHLSQLMAATSSAAAISGLFLAGVVCQVVLAVVNKTAMWGCYYACRHPADAAGKKRFAIAEWVSAQFWIDFVVDMLTLATFAVATWGVLRIVLQVA